MKQVETLYSTWVSVNSWNPRKYHHYMRMMKDNKDLPSISIVIPVYNTKADLLHMCVSSAIHQIYENKEIIIVDDGSTNPDTLELIEKFQKDTRLKVFKQESNTGISEAINRGILEATGDFIAFLDHDDLLSQEALIEVGLSCKDYDIIYTDEDKILEDNQLIHPQFKLHWNPELLLSYMYIGHLLVVRRSLLLDVGMCRKEFDGAQDYDLVLRLTEKTDKILHLPKILYHWRVTRTSTSLGGSQKQGSFEKSKQVIQEALKRRGIQGTVSHISWAQKMNSGFYEIMFPDDGPKVTIIITFHSDVSKLDKCLKSITNKTRYRNYEIVLCLDRPIKSDHVQEYLSKLPYRRYIYNYKGFFSITSLLNKTIQTIENELIVVIHDDVEIIDPQWLSSLVGYCQFEEVGIVGGESISTNNTIQHIGFTHGYSDGGAGSPFVGLPMYSATYQALERIARTATGVYGCCMLLKKKVWNKLGGFNENYSIEYYDVDFSLRASSIGYRTVYTPRSVVVHHQGSTRGKNAIDSIFDQLQYRKTYKNHIDSFHNPNISLYNTQFELKSRCVVTHAMPSIHVLSLAYNLNLEGSSLLQYHILTKLKENRVIEPVVYCYKDGTLRSWYEKQRIPVIILPSPLSEGYNYKAYNRLLPHLQQVIMQTDAQVVHANTLQMFYGIHAAKNLNLPCLWSVHEGGSIDTYFNHFGQDIAKAAIDCFQYPYQIIFVCYDTCRNALKYNTVNNFEVIHTNVPISATVKNKMNDSKIRFLSVGSLCERKNQKLLIESLKHIPSYLHSKYEITIVGNDNTPYGEEVRKEVRSLPTELQNNIKIVGESNNTQEYYQTHDVLVLTSKEESYPLVILEAMQHGLPVIGTGVNGVSEQVLHRITGRVIPPDNSIILGAELTFLLENPEVIERYHKNTILFYEGMNSFDKMIDMYGNLFQEAYLSGKAR